MAKGYVIAPDPEELARMIYNQSLQEYRDDIVRRPTLGQRMPTYAPNEWQVSYMSKSGERIHLDIRKA